MLRHIERLAAPLAWLLGCLSVCTALGAQAASTLQKPADASALVNMHRNFWESPWVWSESQSGVSPLPAIDGQFGQLTTPSLPFHFDDGSVGHVAVETRACTSSDGCAPGDCGMRDSVLIQVLDSSGRRVATWLRCAAYGAFSLVPVDLIEGSGDELIFVYRHGRSSPPHGLDLAMWSVRSNQPERISDTIRVADYLSTACGAVACVRWQTRLVLDQRARGPRMITLRAAFESVNGRMENVDRPGRREAAALRAAPSLVYRDGRYRVERTNALGKQLLKGVDEEPQALSPILE